MKNKNQHTNEQIARNKKTIYCEQNLTVLLKENSHEWKSYSIDFWKSNSLIDTLKRLVKNQVDFNSTSAQMNNFGVYGWKGLVAADQPTCLSGLVLLQNLHRENAVRICFQKDSTKCKNQIFIMFCT